MQVLVLAVQNAVDYADARGRYLRGHAVPRDGRISWARRCSGRSSPRGSRRELRGALQWPARAPGRGRRAPDGRTGGAPAASPRASPMRTPTSTHWSPVFVAASGVALLGFALSWLLPERPLRETAATSRGLDDGLAAPRSPDSLAEVERALTRAIRPGRAPAVARAARQTSRSRALSGGDVGACSDQRTRTRSRPGTWPKPTASRQSGSQRWSTNCVNGGLVERHDGVAQAHGRGPQARGHER